MSGIGKRSISASQVENCIRRLNEEVADSFCIHLEALVLDGFGKDVSEPISNRAHCENPWMPKVLIEAANTIFQLAARECRREFGDRISLGGGPKRSISPPLNIGPLPSEMSAAINNNRVRMLVQSVR